MQGKYERLQQLGAVLPVPAMFALTEAELNRLWVNHAPIRSKVGATLGQIHSTASAFLDEHLADIHEAMKPRWRADADEQLLAALRRANIGPQEALAVRSSAKGEDSDQHSHAGIFLTRLDVSGLAALKRAIEDVWASGFGRAAILERLRHGTLDKPFHMTVVVQRMVRAVWAGVAFSHDPITAEPVCTIEATAGLGESLVSGEAEGVRAWVRNGHVDTRTRLIPKNVFVQVAALTEQAAQAFGGRPVDIEWAFDDRQLWLLQARPITTVGPGTATAGPVLQVVPLYEAVGARMAPFEPLPEFARYFRSKRQPLADFSRRMGLPQAAALLVRANAAGIASAEASALLTGLREPQVVLDMSDRIRQQTLPRERLLDRLQELLGPSPCVFVVRDFIQGRAGLITQPVQAHRVLCEWSTDGLLAINRGIASTHSLQMDGEGHANPGEAGARLGLTPDRLGTLHRVTTAAQAVFGQAQLEWVMHDQGALYLIDYSVLGGLCASVDDGGARVISAGYASGHPMVVDASRDLEQLSIAACVSLTDIPRPEAVGGAIARLYERLRAQGKPTIIVAPRPYAALAPLVPFAAGFLFEKAATLCHLAILLREQGVPAMESEHFYREAIGASNQPLVLNSSALPTLQAST